MNKGAHVYHLAGMEGEVLMALASASRAAGIIEMYHHAPPPFFFEIGPH
jgi:hypothetical protein